MQQLKDFLYAGGEKCKPHLRKLLINTSVLRAQWREGGIKVLDLCLVILKPEKKTETGVQPSRLSCSEQVGLFLSPASSCVVACVCFCVPFQK